MIELTIDKTRLELFLARNCPYYYPVQGSGQAMCCKKKDGACNIGFVEKIEMNCPYDCPHRQEYKWKSCTPDKCSYVKKKIKELR